MEWSRAQMTHGYRQHLPNTLRGPVFSVLHCPEMTATFSSMLLQSSGPDLHFQTYSSEAASDYPTQIFPARGSGAAARSSGGLSVLLRHACGPFLCRSIPPIAPISPPPIYPHPVTGRFIVGSQMARSLGYTEKLSPRVAMIVYGPLPRAMKTTQSIHITLFFALHTDGTPDSSVLMLLLRLSYYNAYIFTRI